MTKGFLQRTVGHVRAVDGVDTTVIEGETLGLVGKTMASRSSCAPSTPPAARSSTEPARTEPARAGSSTSPRCRRPSCCRCGPASNRHRPDAPDREPAGSRRSHDATPIEQGAL